MMSKLLRIALACLFLIQVSACISVEDGATAIPAEVRFSPHGGCTECIVKELDEAHESILIQAYSFTSEPIAKAVASASKRGVACKAILDSSQKSGKYSVTDFLVNSGIETWIDSAHAIAHNKVIIIDDRTVISGSFNFTKAAEESNAENLLVLRSVQLAKLYKANWLAHKEHSTPCNARQQMPR